MKLTGDRQRDLDRAFLFGAIVGIVLGAFSSTVAYIIVHAVTA